ncbi:hypothetical protein Micbo1qcDRAFT_224444 [Microdochium bolleyi]|uniref:Secreted protein n=1 Tax=Microdochium bolleyi TaxID=196109 RepID=A0A136J4Y5_9PEZI|nr:hypothetical protein Micbo1qcDRAFT_224444 [Microdochium bolleyi]
MAWGLSATCTCALIIIAGALIEVTCDTDRARGTASASMRHPSGGVYHPTDTRVKVRCSALRTGNLDGISSSSSRTLAQRADSHRCLALELDGVMPCSPRPQRRQRKDKTQEKKKEKNNLRGPPPQRRIARPRRARAACRAHPQPRRDESPAQPRGTVACPADTLHRMARL